jgi:pimeloyl-ACP methyl ester carboxylesterase
MPLIAHDDVGVDAPTLVLIHAFCCARSDWDAQAAYFVSQRRVVSFDLGGHGETVSRPDHASAETHGADIIALLQ